MMNLGCIASSYLKTRSAFWVDSAEGGWESETVSIPDHNPGDLLIIVACSWNNQTIPSSVDGWTTVLAESFADATGIRVAQKIAESSNDSAGIWPGSEVVFVGIYRGVSSLGSVAGSSDDINSNSYPRALDLLSPGNSYVGTLCVGGPLGVPNGLFPRKTGSWWQWSDTDAIVSEFDDTSGVNANLSISFELVLGSHNYFSAADRFGWGIPISNITMDDPNLLAKEGWLAFEGPGYKGNGIQSASQINISNSVMTITGTPDGLTGSVGFYGAIQTYGRWESRIRIPVTDTYGLYHPVALLWPQSGNWPTDGEIDYFESSTEIGSNPAFALHYAGSGSPVVWHSPVVDNYWHCWAVEWTATHVIAFIDGIEYGRSEDIGQIPPGPMQHVFQLDWVPWKSDPLATDVYMEIDWLRIYSL